MVLRGLISKEIEYYKRIKEIENLLRRVLEMGKKDSVGLIDSE